MIEGYRHLRPRHWMVIVVVALLLLALQEFLPRVYLWALNVLIVAVGLLVAFLILTAARKLLWAMAAIAVGLGWHAWQIGQALADGRCAAPVTGGLFSRLRAWDACIDYADEAVWVVEAQALILGGSLALLVLVIPPIKTALAWMRREFVLWRR